MRAFWQNEPKVPLDCRAGRTAMLRRRPKLPAFEAALTQEGHTPITIRRREWVFHYHRIAVPARMRAHY